MPAAVKGGELLLTHGMSLGATESRQRRHVADLARAVIDEAEHHRLPLVALHQPVPWVEITESITARSFSRQTLLL